MPPEREKAIELRQAIGRGDVQPKRKRKPPPMIKKICGECGKEFETRLSKQKHCSDECRYNAKLKLNARRRELMKQNKKQLVKTCSICGMEFVTATSVQVYCSDDCKKHLANRRTSDYLLLGKRECKRCGKEFQPKRSLMAYCSDQCRDDCKNEQYSEIKARIGGKSLIDTKCPKCGNVYKRVYFTGWIGRGMPRVYCPDCEQYLINKPSAPDCYSVRI